MAVGLHVLFERHELLCLYCPHAGCGKPHALKVLMNSKSEQQITLSRRFRVVLKALAACFVDIQYTQADARERKPVAHTKRTEELINM